MLYIAAESNMYSCESWMEQMSFIAKTHHDIVTPNMPLTLMTGPYFWAICSWNSSEFGAYSCLMLPAWINHRIKIRRYSVSERPLTCDKRLWERTRDIPQVTLIVVIFEHLPKNVRRRNGEGKEEEWHVRKSGLETTLHLQGYIPVSHAPKFRSSPPLIHVHRTPALKGTISAENKRGIWLFTRRQ